MKNVKSIRKIAFNLTALTSVGLGGWCLGKYSEQRRYSRDNETSLLSATRIRNMPGLPLFGTVSAATPLTPAESNYDMGSKMSSTATRVSQVSKPHNRGSAQGLAISNDQVTLQIYSLSATTSRTYNFVICNVN